MNWALEASTKGNFLTKVICRAIFMIQPVGIQVNGRGDNGPNEST